MSFLDLNDSIVTQVRQSADIVDFIGQVTPLKQAGGKFKGLCPFHREKTPSFNVDRAKGLFYCFGCGTGGDVFKFLTLVERMTFPEAVEHVANRVGIAIPKKKRSAKDEGKEDLLEIVEAAGEAYHQALEWKPNPAASYLDSRGVETEVWNRYGFGYAPDSWDYLLTRLGGRFPAASLEKVGLALPRKSGTGHYDRFRNRLMIPIHNEAGTIIGFGGRSLDGSDPKYLNSPESAVFNKSNLLYNLHRAKERIRRLERAVLVEGYFDAIALDYAGVPGVVASMGTSLTPGQASLLRRYARRVLISYDGDNAGRAAALRGAPILLAAGLEVAVVVIAGGKDPDDMIRARGVEAYLEALSTAKDVFEFGLGEWAPAPGQMNAREKAEAVEQFIPLLQAVADPVAKNEAAQRIANALRLEFETIWSRVRGRSAQKGDRVVLAPVSTAEKELLRSLLNGTLESGLEERLRPEFFDDPACRTIYLQWREAAFRGQPLDFSTLATQLKGDVELTRLSELALAADTVESDSGSHADTVRLMERRVLERRLRDIQAEIQEAERDGDTAREHSLYTEKILLSKQLHGLK